MSIEETGSMVSPWLTASTRGRRCYLRSKVCRIAMLPLK